MKEDKYAEFRALSPKERKSLVIVNFFRMRHKLPLIEVPANEVEYHKAFSKIITEKKAK